MSIILHNNMVIVLAKGPDPVQQKLRQSKKIWNAEVKVFVDNLISFKKMVNGQPSKFFKEKSFIQNPIPADPLTILNGLVSDFQEIAQKGQLIVEQQASYSQTRRKKQPKQPNVLTTNIENQPVDLSKQLSAFENKYQLVVEASNPVTRFFTKLLTPTFGTSEAARIRKYRITLLDACAKTNKDLGKLQVEIVKSSESSLETSYKFLQNIWNDWMVVHRGYATYKSNMPKEVVDAGGVIETTEDAELIKGQGKPNKKNVIPSAAIDEELPELKIEIDDPKISAAKLAIEDYKKVLDEKKFIDLISDNASVFLKLNNSIDIFLRQSKKSQQTATLVMNNYLQVLKTLNTMYGLNKSSLLEIATAVELEETNTKDASYTNGQLESVAQDFLKKWLGKARHQLSIFDKTSVFRLDIYNMVQKMRDILNQIMDSLEKDMDISELDPLVLQVNRDMIALRGMMRALHLSRKK